MSIARCAGLAVAVVGTLTVLPVLIGGHAPAQITWTLPSAYPADNFHTQNLDAFARDLAQVTNGKLAIRVYPNASLFPAPAIKSAVRIGRVQIGEILISLHEHEHPIFGVDAVPFLATSYDEARKLWAALFHLRHRPHDWLWRYRSAAGGRARTYDRDWSLRALPNGPHSGDCGLRHANSNQRS